MLVATPRHCASRLHTMAFLKTPVISGTMFYHAASCGAQSPTCEGITAVLEMGLPGVAHQRGVELTPDVGEPCGVRP